MTVIHRKGRMTKSSFRREIYGYYRDHKHALPWRKTKNPYRILVSEVMLQQTQVNRVLLKYKRFIQTFPTFKALAEASLREVLLEWQGLGYNRRAKYLKEIAEIVTEKYHGTLPQGIKELKGLPCIGPYTARAIAAFAFERPHAFLETNIQTVLILFFFKERKNVRDKEILEVAEEMLDRENPREWHFALMDYGAMLKEKVGNLNKRSANYRRQSRFEGSDRQIRGLIIKVLAERERLSDREIVEGVGRDPEQIKKQLVKLLREGMLTKSRTTYSL